MSAVCLLFGQFQPDCTNGWQSGRSLISHLCLLRVVGGWEIFEAMLSLMKTRLLTATLFCLVAAGQPGIACVVVKHAAPLQPWPICRVYVASRAGAGVR